ncbi:MAG: GNAT family N-acetyltransferase [Elusimicrobia bacterium]|nr:GNAT family N-acetyltransferase [Elusimicrobiota bacterium]
MSAESLAGRRTTLRPLAEADAGPLLEAVASSRAQLKRRFGWVESAVGAEDMLRFVRARAEAWSAGSASTFGMFEARTGKLLGVLSLDHIQRETLKAELSLWVRGDEQDKGFAVEAGRLAVEYAFKKLALHRLYARIDPVNRSARKVLQRLGFRYEGCLRGDRRLNGRWVDQECWAMMRSEWRSSK